MKKKSTDAIDKLLSQRVNFLDGTAPGSPVVISSRIRLARNIKNIPFPVAGDAVSTALTADLIAEALKKSQALGRKQFSFDLDQMSILDKNILLERRLISRELLQSPFASAVHISGDEKLSVMVNEEDHLRMQVILPGLQLKKAWDMINKLDDRLSSELEFDYDPVLGYLTACPSNVGTGIRVSVMLHLPALAMNGHIKQLERALAKLGLTVRGMFGEGSENLGNLYQISNQSTLGESEKEIIDNLGRVIDQVIEHEEATRQMMLEKNRSKLMDIVGRSYGMLRYGYLLSSKEAFNSFSGLRLGVDMNLFSTLDIKTVNELFVAVNPGHLQKKVDLELPESERDALRSKVVREHLKHLGSA